jgi:hypothetical protein
MSRAHDRTYRLLSERVRLAAWPRRALYTVVAAVVGSGAWWLVAHYSGGDDLARLVQEAPALKVHGAASFAMLLALGAMSASHVRRGWGLARNRLSGSVLIAVFAVLVATGYALYYLVDDATRPPVSLLHWLVGLGSAPLLLGHIVVGRRSRRPQQRAADRVQARRERAHSD